MAVGSVSEADILQMAFNPLFNAPLASLTNLSQLEFGENQISGLSPLSKLIVLVYVWLYSYRISDLSPLVENMGQRSTPRA